MFSLKASDCLENVWNMFSLGNFLERRLCVAWLIWEEWHKKNPLQPNPSSRSAPNTPQDSPREWGTIQLYFAVYFVACWRRRRMRLTSLVPHGLWAFPNPNPNYFCWFLRGFAIHWPQAWAAAWGGLCPRATDTIKYLIDTIKCLISTKVLPPCCVFLC